MIGGGFSNGLLQLNYGGDKWLTVCDEQLSYHEANAACHAMGFPGGYPAPLEAINYPDYYDFSGNMMTVSEFKVSEIKASHGKYFLTLNFIYLTTITHGYKLATR